MVDARGDTGTLDVFGWKELDMLRASRERGCWNCPPFLSSVLRAHGAVGICGCADCAATGFRAFAAEVTLSLNTSTKGAVGVAFSRARGAVGGPPSRARGAVGGPLSRARGALGAAGGGAVSCAFGAVGAVFGMRDGAIGAFAGGFSGLIGRGSGGAFHTLDVGPL